MQRQKWKARLIFPGKQPGMAIGTCQAVARNRVTPPSDA